jgi:hypothetical protein
MLDWRSFAPLRALDALPNQLIGPFGLDSAVRLLTNGTGTAALNGSLLPPLSLPLLPGLLLHLSIRRLSLGGLDSISELQLLRPSPHDFARLNFILRVERLSAQAEIELRLVPEIVQQVIAADGRRLGGDAPFSTDRGTHPFPNRGGVPLSPPLAGATPSPPRGYGAGSLLLFPPLAVTLRSSLRNLRLTSAARLVINETAAAEIAISQLASELALSAGAAVPAAANCTSCVARSILGVAFVDLKLSATVDRWVASRVLDRGGKGGKWEYADNGNGGAPIPEGAPARANQFPSPFNLSLPASMASSLLASANAWLSASLDTARTRPCPPAYPTPRLLDLSASPIMK